MPNEESLSSVTIPSATSGKFAYFYCEDYPKWENTEYMWYDGLKIGKENFVVYKFPLGEYPTREEISQLKGIVISGSHYSVTEDHAWIQRLLETIRMVISDFPHIKIVAGCFGHQAVSLALGGKVGRNPHGRFVLGVEDLRLKDALRQHPAFVKAAKELGVDPSSLATASVLQSHMDAVLEPAPGATLLADSASADHEVLLVGDNVLTWQSHPEMDRDSLVSKIVVAVTANGRVSEEESAKIKEEVARRQLQDDLMMAFARNFIHGAY